MLAMKLLRNIFVVFSILFWVLNSRAQAFPEKGVGQWQELPFANVRLLSCSTGSQGRNLLVGGLQVEISPGWVLEKPQLKPLASHAVVEYPIRPHPVNFDSYTGTVLFPLIYDISTNKTDIFGMQGNLKACREKDCLEFPVKIDLPLSQNESKYTSFCAYIMNEINQIPKPAAIGLGQWINDHQARLLFYVPKINQAFLQNQNGLNFKILSMKLWSDRVQVTIEYPEKWLNQTMQDWILITDQGAFRVPILLQDKPLPLRPLPFPWGHFLWGAFVLFLCSPFLILWGTIFPKTVPKLRRQCIQAMWVSGILMTVICLIIKYFSAFNGVMLQFSPYFLVILGITLIFPPKNVWWAGILFVFWPKPYLKELVENVSFLCLLPWLLLWQVIPFALLYYRAEFWIKKAHLSLKKSFFYHNLFFLLPTLCLLVIGIYHAQKKIIYDNQNPIDMSRINIVCQPSNCVNWQEDLSNFRLINADSSFGKTLMDLYQAQENVIIFDDSGIQTILIDSQPQKLKFYQKGLKNYRAGYRPTDPPVRSEDAQHDPSPNAK